MESDMSNIDSDDGIISDSYESRKPGETNVKASIKKKKREVIICVVSEKNETLIISQKMERKKVRKNYQNHELMENYRSYKPKNCNKQDNYGPQRILPCCNRLKCINSDRKIQKYHNLKVKTNKKGFENKKTKLKHTPSKTKKHSQNTKESSLSRLNKQSKEQNQLLYEDVSSDSLMSQSDVEIDTLIKRTKEREKSSSFKYPHKHLVRRHSVIKISSEDDLDCSSPSMHSAVTVVLNNEMQDLTYIPTSNYSEAGSSLNLTNTDKLKLNNDSFSSFNFPTGWEN